MGKTALLFGIHMHQPVDNFSVVIERAVRECYAPFFEVMTRHPEFKFALHCSGWLFEQIKTHHAGLFEQIRALAKAGSIEFVTAGYYEPVLSAIPSEDRRAQIGKLNAFLKREFGAEPSGLWLTERVWESSIVPDAAACGVKYTVLDDYHFQCAGFDKSVLDGHFATEEGGVGMGLFPISQALRYALPFFGVDDALAAVKAFAREEDSAAIIFDDAEKFGMWPKTHEWVYEKRWLERFVRAVIEDDEIVPTHFSEYYETRRSRGLAYLPNVSYYEMGEWSLRADDTLALEAYKEAMGLEAFEREGVKFLKGGIWKNFLVKYDESNRLHKRMLELSRVRAELDDAAFDEALYRLQTNDVLWHGVFGGLYLPNLRDNAYRYLVEAENRRYGSGVHVEHGCAEMDGYDKAKAVTDGLIMRFDARHGGQMIEFDDRGSGFNWQNTLTRRKEAYHVKMCEAAEAPAEHESFKEGIDTIHSIAYEVDETLRANLVYDWYLKNSFVDHISDDSFTLEHFRRCDFREYGDFANQPFEMGLSKKSVQFMREGGVYLPQRVSARLQKNYHPMPGGLGFSMKFDCGAERDFVYALEFNFHFADYAALRIGGKALGEEGGLMIEKRFEIEDPYTRKRITISIDTHAEWLYFPLNTVSQSEEGYELTTQSLCLALSIPFGRQLKLEGSIEVSDV